MAISVGLAGIYFMKHNRNAMLLLKMMGQSTLYDQRFTSYQILGFMAFCLKIGKMPKSEWAVRRSKNHDIDGSNGVFTFRGTRSNDLGGVVYLYPTLVI